MDHCTRCGADENLKPAEGTVLCADCRGGCESCGAEENVEPWTDGALVLSLCDHCRLDGQLDQVAIEEDLG